MGGGSGGGGDAFEQFLHHGLFSLRRIRTLGKREIQCLNDQGDTCLGGVHLSEGVHWCYMFVL